MIRVGIDVGGTFTDVVAIDTETRELLARVKVPTSHDAAEGVAAGIVTGLQRAIGENHLDPAAIAFIAHSTTQATNALLEGDVARVGVIGFATSLGAPFVRRQIRFAPLTLAPGASFAPSFQFIGAAVGVAAAVDAMASDGVEAIAGSSAFGVDDEAREQSVVDYARARGLYATSGHEVSSMYGLRARTRTAALNAAILPRMVRTARMTAGAVERAGVAVPLMIMRSDGGVMDVREVERRPILTMLSGPAAGVAGALLHENVTDGIFIEVGGTSSDCSAIRRGVPQMRPARVGGHRTMLRTLDVRTVGIGGGSMLRVRAGKLIGVGPRSAHIAGLEYICFSAPERVARASVQLLAPTKHDPPEYVALITDDGARMTLTPTCAANLLDVIPVGAFARGDREAARLGFALLAAHLEVSIETAARTVLELATETLRPTIDELIADYGFPRASLRLIGGGGGAGALLPFVAEQLKLDHALARDAEVISPIGVALALVRDVVERTIVDPTPEDVVRVRREALERVVAAGAAHDRVEVTVEIDRQRNLVRATASGATALAEAQQSAKRSPDERRAAGARQLGVTVDELEQLYLGADCAIYAATRQRMQRLGWFSTTRAEREVCLVDARAVVRLVLPNANVVVTTAATLEHDLARVIEANIAFGDVGRALPETYVAYHERLVAYGGVAETAQAIALGREEFAGVDGAVPVVILCAPRPA